MATTWTSTPTWWEYAALGVIAILFGLAALFWPAITVGILIILFAINVLISGLVQFVAMFRAIGSHVPWWPHLLLGIINIAAGLIVLAYPQMTAIFLLFVIAFWAIIAGLTEIVASLTTANLLLLVLGIISVVFGLVLLANPARGALALVMVIGIFAIVQGIVLLIRAFSAPSTAAMAP